MPRYASDTSVTSEKSRGEIERILERYGADQFAYGWDADAAVVAFRLNSRQVRLVVPLPAKNLPRFLTYRRGSSLFERTEEAARALWEQECRQRWRALALVIKAKLEAVECGISDFESEFLANIMLPSGATAGEWLKPQIEQAYLTGKMGSLLPLLPERGSS